VKEPPNFNLPSWQAVLHPLHLLRLEGARPGSLLSGSPAGICWDAALLKTKVELFICHTSLLKRLVSYAEEGVLD